MTRGIRDNWVQAINKALITAQEDKAKENITTPSSEDNRSVEEAITRKESPVVESAISPTDATESVSETSSPDRTKVDMRRTSSQREKGRERRSRRSSKDLKEMKRLSNTGLESIDSLQSGNGTNGSSGNSSRVSSSSPVHHKNISDTEKENNIPKEPSSPVHRSSMKNNTQVIDLLETEVG